MARAGDELKGIGSSLRFVETTEESDGERVVVEITYAGGGGRPPVHFHPSQDERFEVLEGEIHAVLDGEERVLRPSDTLEVPAGTHHEMWAAERSRQRWETRPALKTETFFETLWGLQQDGRTNEKGVPGLPQMALTLRYFSDEFRLGSPPAAVQAILLPMLAAVARVQGRRPTYEARPS